MKRVSIYEFGRTLGEGTFGKVKYAVNTTTGEPVAIKVMDKTALEQHHMAEQLAKEIAIMSKIAHPNIVKLIEVMKNKSRIFMVLELVTGGELFDRIGTAVLFCAEPQRVVENKYLRENEARKYFQQLIAGVAYMHSLGVAHRDLKPENLLLSGDGALKISDFGLCAVADAKMNRTACGTPNYVAPEVLSGHRYDGKKADLWSCGIILFVMLAGYLPFEEENNELLFNKIRRGFFEFPAYNFSAEAKRLVQRLLTTNPDLRITIPEVMQDPWFKQGLPPPVVPVPPVLDSLHTSQRHPAPPQEQTSQSQRRTPLQPLRVELPTREVGAVERVMSPTSPTKTYGELPPTMNVFDLVATTMMDISPMFEEGRRRTPAFTTKAHPKELMRRIVKAFQMEGVRCACVESHFKIKAFERDGRTALVVVLHTLTPGLYVATFLRRQAQVLHFHRLYDKVAAHCKDLFAS